MTVLESVQIHVAVLLVLLTFVLIAPRPIMGPVKLYRIVTYDFELDIAVRTGQELPHLRWVQTDLPITIRTESTGHQHGPFRLAVWASERSARAKASR